jgi:hypothetical protein
MSLICKAPQGEFLIFCDKDCRRKYLDMLEDTLPYLRKWRVENGDPFAKALACIHCRGCGYCLWAPPAGACVIHEAAGCPNWDWLLGADAFSFARTYLALTGRNVISDDEWEEAFNLGIEHDAWPGSAVAAALLRWDPNQE